jgi:ABC-type multidrug transport system fused ATPase/permease subunit
VREPEQARHFNEASNELRKANQIAWRVWALYGSSMNLFRFLGVLILVGVGASHVLSGTAELGDVGAFLLLATFLYQPVGKLHELNRLMQEGPRCGRTRL